MRRHLCALVVALILLAPSFAAAAEEELRPLIDALAAEDFEARTEAVNALAAAGDPRVVPVLEALADGNLYVRRGSDEPGRVVAGERQGMRAYDLADPLTGEALGEVGRREVSSIAVNNALRSTIDAAIAGLTLLSPDPATRRAAARDLQARGDPSALPLLERAIDEEKVADIRTLMELARASLILQSAAPLSEVGESEKIAAIETVAARGGGDAVRLLSALVDSASPSVSAAAKEAIARIERRRAMWQAGQNVAYGISLGSVLLLAAIGLAITFGVMGVINMAHGEMVMLGAYTTFAVQDLLRRNAPELLEVSLVMALPLAFLVTGAVGVLIERGVIRFLYGRPLETLLATWGISLILQQTVRSIFGPTNRQVGNPSWMSGSVELGGLTLTMNRLWIIVFALVVFAALILILRFSRFGLSMRAVTQNRGMAASMGIRTDRIDALTFGLGSGIAGIAGVALSQIDNVSPNLGQSYIVDSFMVVVFGGVGNLWGTLVGAMTLGVANKFLEPYAGAVLAKILILVLVILFIQKRPRGIFALRGRAAEA